MNPTVYKVVKMSSTSDYNSLKGNKKNIMLCNLICNIIDNCQFPPFYELVRVLNEPISHKCLTNCPVSAVFSENVILREFSDNSSGSQSVVASISIICQLCLEHCVKHLQSLLKPL